MPRNISGLKRGGPGRTKGVKDRVPRSFKASIRAIFEEVATTEPNTIRRAVIDGLKAKPPRSAPYLTLAAAYIDGRPKESVTLEGSLTIDLARQAQEAITRKLARLAADRDANAVDAGVEP